MIPGHSSALNSTLKHYAEQEDGTLKPVKAELPYITESLRLDAITLRAKLGNQIAICNGLLDEIEGLKKKVTAEAEAKLNFEAQVKRLSDGLVKYCGFFSMHPEVSDDGIVSSIKVHYANGAYPSLKFTPVVTTETALLALTSA
jgi:hypothetical protein